MFNLFAKLFLTVFLCPAPGSAPFFRHWPRHPPIWGGGEGSLLMTMRIISDTLHSPSHALLKHSSLRKMLYVCESALQLYAFLTLWIKILNCHFCNGFYQSWALATAFATERHKVQKAVYKSQGTIAIKGYKDSEKQCNFFVCKFLGLQLVG